MCKFGNLKKGDKLSETQFYTVEKTKGNEVQLINDNNESIVVNKNYVNACLETANQFDKVEKITRTELAEKFKASSNVALTVSFNKLVKEADVVKEIKDAYENSTPKNAEKAMKSAVKKALSGEERTMVGRHYGSVDDFGRITFIDMQAKKDSSKKEYDTRARKVDPRTINFLVCRGVKYEAK